MFFPRSNNWTFLRCGQSHTFCSNGWSFRSMASVPSALVFDRAAVPEPSALSLLATGNCFRIHSPSLSGARLACIAHHVFTGHIVTCGLVISWLTFPRIRCVLVICDFIVRFLIVFCHIITAYFSLTTWSMALSQDLGRWLCSPFSNSLYRMAHSLQQ